MYNINHLLKQGYVLYNASMLNLLFNIVEQKESLVCHLLRSSFVPITIQV